MMKPLAAPDLSDLEALYRASYPGNWFDPRMLETGCYYGIRRDGGGGALVSARQACMCIRRRIRLQLWATSQRTTEWRGKGLGGKVTARLCQELRQKIDHIGLNVKAGNQSAIGCYERLGFTRDTHYTRNAGSHRSD
ncbi:MAG: GNAT family N-acetyltransferase [Pyrinomonadaceae bacterium]